MVYNQIDLGFCSLEIYTTEDGIHSAQLKSKNYKSEEIMIPRSDIYVEKVVE
jgi:hypothetical protein